MSLQEHLPLIMIEPGLLVPAKIPEQGYDVFAHVEMLSDWIRYLGSDDSKWLRWYKTKDYDNILIHLYDRESVSLLEDLQKRLRGVVNVWELRGLIVGALDKRAHEIPNSLADRIQGVVQVENPFRYVDFRLQVISDSVVDASCAVNEACRSKRLGQLNLLVAYREVEINYTSVQRPGVQTSTVTNVSSMQVAVKEALFHLALKRKDESLVKEAVLLCQMGSASDAFPTFELGSRFVSSCDEIIGNDNAVGDLLFCISEILVAWSTDVDPRIEKVEALDRNDKKKYRRPDGARPWHAKMSEGLRLNFWETKCGCLEFANVEYKSEYKRKKRIDIKRGNPLEGCGKRSRSVKKRKK